MGVGILLTLVLLTARDDDPAATFFDEKIAPILEARCVSCHGGAKPKGGLGLETREAMKRGSDAGPVVEPDDLSASVLLEAVSGDEPTMPRGADALSAEQVADLRAWVAAGATWPEGRTLVAKPDGSTWWSLRPMVLPDVPKVARVDWAREPIDRFILARLEEAGLAPNPEADRRTYLRRVTFDLTGLPPTPAAIAEFLGDDSFKAYERLVDRLLASPAYGERWGRHWLDLVHYADTHGYDKDKRREHAWRYRDYVIGALNRDLPYPQFVREQLAGDALAPDDPGARVATGFVVAGPWDFVGQVELREGTVDKEKTRVLDRDDMVTNAISTFASLTVHCARCHDHKFDPITQHDYYRFQAVFAGVERADVPLASIGTPPSEAASFAVKSIEPRLIRLLNRGDVEQPGEEVAPGALACLDSLGLASRFESGDEAGRRAALADWLVDKRNPLTWRSIVNRVWQHHFGRGLVDTPSDFGRNGSKPSHPELLDYLAATFRDELDGSLKGLHRRIVLTATYRQSSADRPEAAAIDADARLLWRQHRRRIEAEVVRDGVMSVAGTLDRRMGGPGYALFRFVDDHSPIYDHDDPAWIDPPEGRRRSIYRFAVRSVTNPFLDCLDAADPNLGVPVRNETITALQALALLNDPFMVDQAEAFAARVEAEAGSTSERIDRAFLLSVGRKSSDEERTALGTYAERHGLPAACRLLFNLNEFVMVD